MDKLKIMIVDDEALVRSLIRVCLNWEELGGEIVAEASSASDAYEQIGKVNPDIIFTDINMPMMDGITFAKQVAENYPFIKVVVITGYEEFEYAKRSIKVGISDFLTKPIDDEELEKVFLKLKDKIFTEKKKTSEYSELKKHLEENKELLIDNQFKELLVNDGKMEERLDELRYFGIDLSTGSYEVAVIETELVVDDRHRKKIDVNEGKAGLNKDDEIQGESMNPVETSLEEMKIMLPIQTINRVKKYFRNDEEVYVFFDHHHNLIILNHQQEVVLKECLEEIKVLLMNQLSCRISIGLGTGYKDSKGIYLSYHEALQAQKYKMIVGQNQIIYYKEIAEKKDDSLVAEENWRENMRFFIKAGLKTEAMEYLEKTLGGLIDAAGFEHNLEPFRGGEQNSAKLSAIGVGFVGAIMDALMEMDMNKHRIIVERQKVFEKLMTVSDIPTMHGFLLELMEEVTGDIHNSIAKRNNSKIDEIKNYIVEQLANEELSLKYVSEKFYLNASYLSRIFKEMTGTTFVAYVTKLRMEQAIEYLKTTDLKAYEIGEKVGIVDSHYFGLCFKKYSGMSVTQFKKQVCDD